MCHLGRNGGKSTREGAKSSVGRRERMKRGRGLHLRKGLCVFIMTDKAKLVGEEVKGVGVMKDEELKLEEIEASLTLGG
jgi:hypothetical protein